MGRLGTQTVFRSLVLIGGSFLAYPGGAQTAAAPEEGAQALAKALLTPQVRSGTSVVVSDAGAGERRSEPDAVHLAQRLLLGAADPHADRPGSSATEASASARPRLAARRHDADANELVRRVILGQGA